MKIANITFLNIEGISILNRKKKENQDNAKINNKEKYIVVKK